MVKYYGRARQRTGAVNRIQPGLKMQGTFPRTGRLISTWRVHQSRVNGNVAVGCAVNGVATGQRRVFDEKLCVTCVTNATTRFLLVTQAPASRQCAGGVNRYFPLGCR
jgi:hypothetical protein